MIYTVDTLGTDKNGAIRIRQHIDEADALKAARNALWWAENKGVAVNSLLVTDRDGSLRPVPIDEIRPPFFGSEVVANHVRIAANHLPPLERNAATENVQRGAWIGMIGAGALALDVESLDIFEIEDDYPMLSTLIQIAKDEAVPMLILDVDGTTRPDGEIFADE